MPENASHSPFGDNSSARLVTVDAAGDGQRLDNFLMRILKGVPKSHVYRIVRSGEVRINKGRCQASDHVAEGDVVRVPPVRVSAPRQDRPAVRPLAEGELPVLYEDGHLLVVDKPSGLAAHGGSGVSGGLIERLRASRPAAPFLELAHRLDRDTSGALVVCKTRKALVRLHEAQREGEVSKRYRLLVAGDWVNERQHVKLPLNRYTLASGERRVRVDQDNGLPSHTIFTLLARYGEASYLEAQLLTGRTHQIRVHAASQGFPLAGDDKYGDYAVNAALARGSLGLPLKRLFLHAASLSFAHPVTGEALAIEAPLPAELQAVIDALAARGPRR
ncbi:MAG: RluA family pseudouridine synthase [Duodenibacillus sp.]|nr:RluA family pseudouridine synthase [Duodenibacillus sp.]